MLSEQGKEAVVALLGVGDFFGESCLGAQPRRMATASAMTDCSIAHGKGGRRPRDPRTAQVLLLLANFGKENKPEPVIAKISQETLAEMIGTTRSRVSFFMNKFRQLGFNTYNRPIEVHSSLLNVVLHEKPEINAG